MKNLAVFVFVFCFSLNSFSNVKKTEVKPVNKVQTNHTINHSDPINKIDLTNSYEAIFEFSIFGLGVVRIKDNVYKTYEEDELFESGMLRISLRIIFNLKDNHYLGLFYEASGVSYEIGPDGDYVDFGYSSILGYRYLKKFSYGDVFMDIVPIWGVSQDLTISDDTYKGPGLLFRIGAAIQIYYIRLGLEVSTAWLGMGTLTTGAIFVGRSW
jgi:hypothetical protein